MDRLLFLDVDGTLIDEHEHPRPKVLDLIRGARQLGWLVIIWSGGGADYARTILNRYFPEARGLVAAIVHKADVRLRTVEGSRFVVDDEQAVILTYQQAGHDGMAVPLYEGQPDDTAMLAVLDALKSKET